MKNNWLVVLGFNTTLTAKVIWRLVTHMCFPAFSHQYLHNLSFQSHRLLFSHASAKARGENTPERKVASTRDRTHNHQVMSPTRSPLSHRGRAMKNNSDSKMKMVLGIGENILGKGENAGYQHFLLFHTMFSKAFFSRGVKSGLCGNGLTNQNLFLCDLQQFNSFPHNPDF